jgi:apolipoprotein N-acyltransferase
MVLKYFLAWFPMVGIAILNGILRQSGYGPYFAELTAHQISTGTGIILMSIYIRIVTGYFPIQSSRQAAGIGVLWFVLTVVFEFGFGHFLMGHSWSKLFHDYNILEGRVWALFLIWLTISPYLFFKLIRK